MRRPANHALYNKLRPSDVGLDADKPTELKEGEKYFATDTYRIYYGGKPGEAPFITEGFPYYLTMKDPGGSNCFRFFVDPINGDDANNGQSWANAKATFSSVYAALPQNLNDHMVFIYFSSGTVNDSWNVRFYDGEINHHWCGSYLNDLTDDWSMFRKGGTGENFQFTDMDQTIIKGNINDSSPFIYNGADYKIDWAAFNHNFPHWQDGFCFYDRIVFEDMDTVSADEHDYIIQNEVSRGWGTYTGITFKPIGSKTACFYGYQINGGMCGVKFDMTKSIGELKTSTSIWRALVMMRGNDPTNKFGFGTLGSSASTYVKYDATYKPANWLGGNDHQIIIEGDCSNIWSNGGGVSKANFVTIDANGLEYTGSGTPRIMTSADFQGTIEYASANVTLVDASTKPRVIKDYTTNVETVYLTNGIQQAGDNVVFDLPTSDPSVAGALWNDTGTVKVSAGP